MPDSDAPQAATSTSGSRRPGLPRVLGSLLLALACGGDDPTGTEFPTLLLTTTSLPAAELAVDYDESLGASGGDLDYTWSIVSGSLPPGLSLGATTGVVSGASTVATGAFSFTVRVSSGDGQTAEQVLSVDVLPPDDLIAFQSTRDSNTEIYVVRPDQSGLSRITTNTDEDRDPAWSPDRTRIAFSSDRDGNDEIYTMTAGGTDPVRLTTTAGSERRPAYSPDGTKVAFDSDDDGDEEIVVLNADGTGVALQLTDNGVRYDQGPTWSMNSSQILFTTFRDGLDNLYLMNADGSGPQTLVVDTGEHDWQPEWSPDGTRIVFTSADADGDWEIFIVDADGTTGLQQLTSNTARDTEATWSSNSNWIAFTSDRGGDSDIYIMTPDGGNVMQVTTDPADDSRPSWTR